ncbi:type II toxin-antitoxin system HicB family antitoxin [Patescibacteria group bacterium]|jgi:predicted RNase H-like HicB family nuclease|nr:type II toxin-antitoxin system HicB family antitoxin [Patescibacteria group bacterium]
MKNYTVYIEEDEDGVLIGTVPSLPGCHTQGASMDELLANLKEVVALCARNHAPEEHSRFVGVQTIDVPA